MTSHPEKNPQHPADQRQPISRSIWIQIHSRIIRQVIVDEIQWLEAAGNYVKLHLGAEHVTTRSTMDEIETLLTNKCFIRIHRRVIANIAHVREFHSSGRLRIILLDGTHLPVGKSYLNTVRSRLVHGSH